jgi:hypothetical protein
MSEDIKTPKSELFYDLSEQEQESVVGGISYYSLDIQKTDIYSYALNETNFSDGNKNFSTKQQTGYLLSQITIGLNIFAQESWQSFNQNSLYLFHKFLQFLDF